MPPAAVPQFTREAILQGETFDFRTPVVVEGPVEAWMTSVEQEMRTTLHRFVDIKGMPGLWLAAWEHPCNDAICWNGKTALPAFLNFCSSKLVSL